MSEPLTSHKNWTLDMEGKNNMFKGRSMIVIHQILNQFLVFLFSFALVAIGHSCGLYNGHIITHRINKTDEPVGINLMDFVHAHFPFSIIHWVGALTLRVVGHLTIELQK